MSGQTYSNSSQFYGNQLSDVLRLAVEPLCKFRQLADSQISAGRHRGNTMTWSIMGDISTPGGVISETATIPVGSLTVSQGTLTVSEFGQAVSWSRFLEDLSKFSIDDALGVALTNDCAKTLDRQVWAQFKTTTTQLSANANSNSSVLLWAGSQGSPNNVTQTNNVTMTLAHVRSISNLLKNRNVPAFRGQDYYCIARPSTFEGIQSGSPQGATAANTSVISDSLQGVHQYTATGLRYIMEGEIGRYRNVRFLEQTNVGAGIGNTGLDPTFYTTSDMTPWVQGASDWAYFVGEDTVIEGIVVPEQLISDVPHDFFRSKYLAWYYNGGFSLTQFQPTNSRVFWWNSLA